ncbi:putative ferric-chelate reductase 1 [Physella acuta]|uniref:putative ferric-chelate reductase 1 n=1 Tax=Physella acuta TaxID=109671 RepID=UPI0027DB2C01|nr:putative ferric-chelate reductase 1 [Physella acuta]
MLHYVSHWPFGGRADVKAALQDRGPELTSTACRPTFIGVYVQPRLVGCHVNTTRTVGVFTAADPRLQTRHCFGVIHSTVTHTSKVKKNHVALLWTAPVRSSGHVVIKATIVKDKETFWVDVDSPPLIDLQTMDTPTCMSHTHRDGFKFDHKNNRYEANKLTDSGKESSSSRPQWHFILLLMAVMVRGVIQLL